MPVCDQKQTGVGPCYEISQSSDSIICRKNINVKWQFYRLFFSSYPFYNCGSQRCQIPLSDYETSRLFCKFMLSFSGAILSFLEFEETTRSIALLSKAPKGETPYAHAQPPAISDHSENRRKSMLNTGLVSTVMIRKIPQLPLTLEIRVVQYLFVWLLQNVKTIMYLIFLLIS